MQILKRRTNGYAKAHGVLATLLVFGLIAWCLGPGFTPAAFPRLLGNGTYTELGRGSFAVVSLITEKATGQEYAFKRLRPDRTNHLSEFLHGIGVQKKLSGLNGVPKVHRDSLTEDPQTDAPWVVMELTGPDFIAYAWKDYDRQHIYTMFFGVLNVMGILRGVHEKGLIHRDVKPENMAFARKTAEVFLLDYDSCKKGIPVFTTKELPDTDTPRYWSLSLHREVADSGSDAYTYSAWTDLESIGWTWALLCSAYGGEATIYLPGLAQYMFRIWWLASGGRKPPNYQDLANILQSSKKPSTGWDDFTKWFLSVEYPRTSMTEIGEYKETFQTKIKSMSWEVVITLDAFTIDGGTLDMNYHGRTCNVVKGNWLATQTSCAATFFQGNIPTIAEQTHVIEYFTDAAFAERVLLFEPMGDVTVCAKVTAKVAINTNNKRWKHFLSCCFTGRMLGEGSCADTCSRHQKPSLSKVAKMLLVVLVPLAVIVGLSAAVIRWRRHGKCEEEGYELGPDIDFSISDGEVKYVAPRDIDFSISDGRNKPRFQTRQTKKRGYTHPMKALPV